ncbi:MAG: hypothetical protein IKJ94_01860 [Oscillospiraceae bacterium]|nr:hypothetical protein [Oscillospiraceae bacterium]
MPLQRYTAITNAEFYSLSQLPPKPAWMACHFSGYNSGLSNMPDTFPADSLIMLDDSAPIQGHDPQRILQELTQLCEQIKPAGFLLDFQRAGIPEAAQLAKRLCRELPCPVAVSHLYAEDLECPVFLPPPPLHKPLAEHLKSWGSREIWLEIALDSVDITVTREGCQVSARGFGELPEPVFYHEGLFCRYHTQVLKDRVIFTLQRGQQDWEALLAQAEKLGVRCCVGLYENSRI